MKSSDLAVEAGYKWFGLNGVEHISNPKPKKYNVEKLIVDTLCANEPRLLLNIPCLIYKQKVDFEKLYGFANDKRKLAQLGTILDITARIIPNNYKQKDKLKSIIENIEKNNFPVQYLINFGKKINDLFYKNVSPNRFNVKNKMEVQEYKEFFDTYAHQ